MSPRIAGVLLCATVVALSACGGTKLVKHAPPPPQLEKPLAAAMDSSLNAALDWVIVRNGPGTWARNADWDEYLIRVHNTSDAPLQLDRVSVVDSLDQHNGIQPTRSALVKASRQNAKRYKQSGLKIAAGRGGGSLGAMGAGATATGVAYGSTLSLGFMGGSSSSSMAFGTAAGLIVAGPVIATIAIVRGVRNGKVNNRIEQRHSALPVALVAGEDVSLDLFFPLSPAPKRVEISYTDAQGVHQLDIDTTQALTGLHLPAAATAAATLPSANATPVVDNRVD